MITNIHYQSEGDINTFWVVSRLTEDNSTVTENYESIDGESPRFENGDPLYDTDPDLADLLVNMWQFKSADDGTLEYDYDPTTGVVSNVVAKPLEE